VNGQKPDGQSDSRLGPLVTEKFGSIRYPVSTPVLMQPVSSTPRTPPRQVPTNPVCYREAELHAQGFEMELRERFTERSSLSWNRKLIIRT